MLSRSTAGTGIDLGHHSIKLVRLERNGQDPPRVTHWGEEEVRAGDGDPIRARGLALKRLLKGLRLKGRRLGRVASAVGSNQLYLRQVALPALSPEDLRRALPYEARKHFPLDTLPDPLLDVQVLGEKAPAEAASAPPEGTGRESAEPTRQVLLAAVPRKQRDEVLKALDVAGIEPDRVDAEPLPALNTVLDLEERGEEPVAVAGLGAQGSFLAAVTREGGVYARSLRFSGEALTAQIQEKLGFDRETAEAMKKDLSGPEAEQVASLLAEPLGELVGEIAETLRFLSMRQHNHRLTRLHVCGGAALTAGLQEDIARGLGLDVIQPDPFRLLRASDGSLPEPRGRMRFVVAVGLARGWE